MVVESEAILGPDYDQIRPMSSGGLGELFRAHKRGLDVEVVVKRVKAQFRNTDSEIREANILKNLRHQYLPRIYDIIYGQDGYIYTVMDYIPGKNLHEIVEEQGAVGQKQALFWLRQLCSVVEYLHSQRPPVIHCDIKPQNIMITPEGDICLIDFNTSLIFSDIEMNAIGVTHGYAAPEQYRLSPKNIARMPENMRARWSEWSAAASRFGKISERTDLYAIGAVAYFMLTGFSPAHSLGRTIPLSQYDIRVTDAFRGVIERAMSPMPRDRYPGAAAMGGALSKSALKKADRRYRAWKRSCQLTAVVLGSALMVSVFCVWLGFDMRSRDLSDRYMELIRLADSQIAGLEYDESLATLTDAMVIDRERIEAYIRASTVLYRTGKYSECEDLLSDITFVYDESVMTSEEFSFAQAEISYILGSCYFNQENYENALVNLSMAVQFAPDEPIYYRDLAVTQALLGHLDDARESLAALEESGGTQDDILFAEGEILYARGDYENALPDFLTLTGSTDSGLSARAWLRAARCCRYSGDVDREIEILSRACTVLDPNAAYSHSEELVEAYLRRAGSSGDMSDYENALTVSRNLMDRGTASLSVRLNAALALQYLGRTDEAAEILSAVITDFPNSYRGYMRMALLKLDTRVNDIEGAAEYYEQAVALYGGAGETDSEMEYLSSAMKELTDIGQ